MAQMKFRVSPKAAPFIQGGSFRFRVSYDKNYGEKPQHIVTRNLPTVTVPQLGVVATTNPWTQQALARMIVPQNTRRGGQKHPAGNLFEDVTGQPFPIDVDLDTILT